MKHGPKSLKICRIGCKKKKNIPLVVCTLLSILIYQLFLLFLPIAICCSVSPFRIYCVDGCFGANDNDKEEGGIDSGGIGCIPSSLSDKIKETTGEAIIRKCGGFSLEKLTTSTFPPPYPYQRPLGVHPIPYSRGSVMKIQVLARY